MNVSNLSLSLIIQTLLFFCTTAAMAEQHIRPLDWSKLEAGVGDDELGALCATVIEYTQKDMGKDWLEKVESARRVGEFLDFGYIEPSRKKGRRRAMEDCIRPVTTSSRTLILAIQTGQYREEIAGVPVEKIKELLPLVIRSIAKDHKINGGIGRDTWGDSWQSAMWAGNLGQVAWVIWDELSLGDRSLVTNVLVHEADRFLKIPARTSDANSVKDTKGEENVWNSTCLLTASTMFLDHPHEQAWREQAITYFLNAVATPHDLKSNQIVDGKPLAERLLGYCITEDYAVGNHGVYPHPGYTSSSYLNTRGVFFCTLAGVKPPEALFYNAAPIYRMFIDHQWSAPPCTAPGGTIYKADGGIYWPVEKERERAGRYYKWFKQDIMAATYGFDATCSIKAADWAVLHGQLIVDALTGKPVPVELESYHKGAFFKTALSCYIIRVLHVNNQLAPIRALSAHVLESGSVSLSVDTAGVRLLPAKDGNNAYRNPATLGSLVHADKKNVLMILVDDLRPSFGAYGAGFVHSPNLDRLAARGMRFDRAYCNQAVCAPSRNNLMTGLRSTSLGVYGLGTSFRDAVPDAVTLTQYFMEHGYKPEGVGKIFHIGHGNYGDDASWSVPFHPDKVIDYVLEESTGGQLTREEAYFSNLKLDNIKTLPRGAAWERADVGDDAYADGRIALEGIKRLRRFKEGGEPFFLALGFTKPHLPFCAPSKYWDLYRNEQFSLTERDTLPDGAPPYAGKTKVHELTNFKPVPEDGENISAVMQRTLIHGYYAALSYMDAQLGRVLDELDRLGLAENTIIVLWGDHGYHFGDHGTWTKHTNYEADNRIPLLLVVPGITRPGSSTQAFAETVDVYPTLVELAGLPAPVVPQGLDGKSLLPVLTDPEMTVRDHAYHAFNRGPRIGRAIRTDRYRMVEWKRAGAPESKAQVELYDYKEDALEKKNIAASNPEVLSRMKAILARHPEAVPVGTVKRK